jgi:hypothetical protein
METIKSSNNKLLVGNNPKAKTEYLEKQRLEHNQVKNDLVVQIEEVKRLKRREETLKANQDSTFK